MTLVGSRRSDTEPAQWIRLYSYLPARRRWQTIVVLGMMLVGAIAEVMTLGAILPFLTLISNPSAINKIPVFVSITRIIGLTTSHDLLMFFGILFCVIALSTAAIRITLAWATQKFVFRVGFDLGVAVYKNVLYQPYQFHVSSNSSEVISLMAQVQTAVVNVLLPLMQGLSSALIAMFLLIGLLFIDPIVAVSTGVAFSLIYIITSIVTRSRLRKNSTFIMGAHKRRIQTVQEGLGGIRDVILDNAQEVYLEKFAKIDTKLRDSQAANALIAAAPRFVVESIGMVLIVALALTLSTKPGGLMGALPVLGALALGAQRILPLLQIVYNGWSQVMGNHAVLIRIMQALARPMPVKDYPSDRQPPISFDRELTLDHVSFSYSDDLPPALSDVSITIRKGEKIGFVGTTGSGKSTAIDLLMGLLSPTQGEVLVDGTAINRELMPAWQRRIAHVPQQIYLSDATIAENIAFAIDPKKINMERVRHAAERADIALYIESQPFGYDTAIGERGIKLSGGQRQRIGIARALYKRSEILVLDEATSALDGPTEQSVMNALDQLSQDVTVIMIAHRLSTLAACDRIFRLEHGRLVNVSTYAELSVES